MNKVKVSELGCAPNPCNSCPYRRDTPSGIWAKEEYDKLPAWDEQWGGGGVFLCHNAPDSLCRGWLEVHHRNIGVRLASCGVKWTAENSEPTKVPLYASGAEARKAGIRGIKNPSKKAIRKIDQILERRARRKS
jgi:hypothetical protein